MSKEKFEIQVCDDLEGLGQAAAERFARITEEGVTSKGSFTVALSGGSTPRALYSKLAAAPFKDRLPWPKVHLFWGDERCVPPDHPDSNYRMVNETLLAKVAIPGENVYRMPAEKENPEQAAAEYERILKSYFHLRGRKLPRFDLILLGMGEDGHTASLFPGTAALGESERLVAAPYVEKLRAYRLTLTLPVLNHAANVIFLVSGKAKATVLGNILGGKYLPDPLPAQLIRPAQGRLLWIIDRAAASALLRGKEGISLRE